jgi:hypothetical protein
MWKLGFSGICGENGSVTVWLKRAFLPALQEFLLLLSPQVKYSFKLVSNLQIFDQAFYLRLFLSNYCGLL